MKPSSPRAIALWRNPRPIADGPFTDWTTALDATDNGQDLAVDYRRFRPVAGRYVRLVITGTPRYNQRGRIRPGVVSFTVFGTRQRP